MQVSQMSSMNMNRTIDNNVYMIKPGVNAKTKLT